MKNAFLVAVVFGAGLLAGCADLNRSRDLNNPKVPAIVIAQQVCSNCHSIDGNSVSPNFPKLASQPVAYLVSQLKEFRSHHRQDPAGFEYMWGLSRNLTDDQIQGLATYFNGQQPSRGPLEGTAERAAAGKTLFDKGLPGKNVPACATCHGESAQGKDTFPRLAGQHADYVIKQLVVFQRTDQRPDGAIMKVFAHELSADDIRNVATYVQSVDSP
jgi:cytochrome c553